MMDTEATVKPCIKCGAVDRDATGRCKPCRRADYSMNNSPRKRALHRAASARWTDAHREELREIRKENAASNNARSAAWYVENRERAAIRGKAYYETHKEEYRAYAEANRERIGARTRVNNLRKYGISVEQYATLLASQGSVCAICLQPATEGRNLDVEHDHSCCPIGKSCGRCITALVCPYCNKHVIDAVRKMRADPAMLARALRVVSAKPAQAILWSRYQ